MIRSYKYSWECMYLRKGKIIRWLWGIKATIIKTKYNKSSGIQIGDKSENREQLELIKRTTRRCFLMRRVKMKGEHNKEEVQRWMELGTWPGVTCEVWRHYQSYRRYQSWLGVTTVTGAQHISCSQVHLSAPNPELHDHKTRSWHPLLSGRTLHGDVWRTGVDGKGLGFNLCVAPPHDRVVPNFGVTEFTKVFQSTLEKMEKTE